MKESEQGSAKDSKDRAEEKIFHVCIFLSRTVAEHAATAAYLLTAHVFFNISLTTDTLLRKVGIDEAIIRLIKKQEDTMSVFSNIVCCISLSENPDDVAQYVNDITRQNDAKLILVHVAADNEAILRRTGSKSMVEKLIEESRKANEDAFTKYVNQKFAGLDTTIVLTEGKVEEELLRVIDKYCADLIVIGSMSTKGLFGSLFNKPSESIIGKTRIPVMVIPNDLSLECTPDF